jgi:hypothetical protein
VGCKILKTYLQIKFRAEKYLQNKKTKYMKAQLEMIQKSTIRLIIIYSLQINMLFLITFYQLEH